MTIDELDDKTAAATFRRLILHLRHRTDAQNVDLMGLAGFCRNCLANWLREAADAQGAPMSKDEAREHVYGMPYSEWKARYQTEADNTQLSAFKPDSHPP